MVVNPSKSKFEILGAALGFSASLAIGLLVVFQSATVTQSSLQTTMRNLFESTLSRIDLTFSDLELNLLTQEQIQGRLNTLIRFQSYLENAEVYQLAYSKKLANNLTSQGLHQATASINYLALQWHDAKTRDLGEFSWAQSSDQSTLFIRRPIAFEYRVVGEVYITLRIHQILSTTVLKLSPESLTAKPGGSVCLSNRDLVAKGETPCFIAHSDFLVTAVIENFLLLFILFVGLTGCGFLIGLLWKKIVYEPKLWLRALSESVDREENNYIENEIFNEIRNKSTAYSNLISAVQKTQMTRLHTQIAHDLRSPLAALKAISHKHPQSESTILKEVVNRINQICESILKHEKPQSRANVIKIISSIVEEKKLIATNIEFTISAHGEALWAKIDESKFSRAISNLLNNAIEHSHSGSTILILIKLTRRFVKICIQDHGKGIPKEDLKNIGRIRHSSRESDVIPGLGLGTTYAKRIFGLAGGKIVWESKLNRGTTVTITIPKETSK